MTSPSRTYSPPRGCPTVTVGQRIKLHPLGGGRWWTVHARDDRFIIATRQAPFHPKGELEYTVIDLTGWLTKRYNGAGEGIVRSSLDTLGGGYDIGPNGEGCEAMLSELVDGTWGLSHRRVSSVWSVTVEGCASSTPTPAIPEPRRTPCCSA